MVLVFLSIVKSTSETIRFRIIFSGRFLISDSISSLIIGLFRFFLWFNLGMIYVSQKVSISSRLSHFWCIILHSIFLWCIFIYVASMVKSPIEFQILVPGVLAFFFSLVNVAKVWVHLVWDSTLPVLTSLFPSPG